MAFSAKERKDGGEDLTSDGSVTKNILVEGGGEKAGRGAKVTVKYSMRLSEDRTSEPFDTSEKRKDGVLQFTLGKRKVIPALEIVTKSMKLGEKCEATASAPYAFGTRGLKRKGVPANARIYIEVEMLACEGGEKVKSMAEMTPSERFAEAQRCKESGNNFFKELKYEKAMSHYSQCITYLSNVFYKPSPSLSDAGATPISNSSAEPKGAPSIQPDAAKSNQDGEGKGEAEQEGPDEEGFAEAEILEESPATAKASSANATEEVATIDVSTASHRDDRSGAVNTKATESTCENGREPPDSAVTESTTPLPKDQSAADEKDDATQPLAESEDPEEKDVVALHVTTLNNLSLCLVKLEDYKRAVETASLALRMDPENYKAMYYRGRAQIAIGDWDKARSDLVSAAKIQPNNIGIRMEIQKLDKKKKQFEQKEKKQAAAMFA